MLFFADSCFDGIKLAWTGVIVAKIQAKLQKNFLLCKYICKNLR